MKSYWSEAINLAEDYKEDFGLIVEVYYYNSPLEYLDVNNFKFSPLSGEGIPSSGHGPGILVHTGDEHFEKNGENLYAVVVQKGFEIEQLSVDGSGMIEIFIPQNRVEDIVATEW